MKIRKALKEDMGALAEIEKEYRNYPAWGERGLEAEFKNKHSVTLIAEGAAKEIAGFINFWLLPPSVQLNAIIVSKKNLRNGIASKLLDKMIKYAGENACEAVDLEVNIENGVAISFYNKTGFKKVGKRLKFYKGKDDALLMKRMIYNEKI